MKWSLLFWNTLVHIYFDRWNPQCLFNSHLLPCIAFLNTRWVQCVLETEGMWSLTSRNFTPERRLSLEWQVISSLCFKLWESALARVMYPIRVLLGERWVWEGFRKQRGRTHTYNYTYFKTRNITAVPSVYCWVNIHLTLQQTKS